MFLHLSSLEWKCYVLPWLFLFTVFAYTQSKPLTNEDVVKMAKSDFSEEMIIKIIEANDGVFDTSMPGLFKLKQAGIGERALSAMMAKTRTLGQTPLLEAPNKNFAETKDQKTLRANTQSESEKNFVTRTPTKVESKPPLAEFELPTEVGIYLVERGQLVELFPEVVNWKTGGALKSMASMGLNKGHINGTVRNPNSKQQASSPLEIVIRCAQGTAPTEYQLLRLWEKDNRREFRALTGGIIHASKGAQKNAVEFTPVRIAPSTYKIVLNDLKKGEYGFLAPGTSAANMAASGKIYTFGIE